MGAVVVKMVVGSDLLGKGGLGGVVKGVNGLLIRSLGLLDTPFTSTVRVWMTRGQPMLRFRRWGLFLNDRCSCGV